jgi:hypothetical protein
MAATNVYTPPSFRRGFQRFQTRMNCQSSGKEGHKKMLCRERRMEL